MMVGTLIFSLLGVAPIVVHANGLWLNTTVSYPCTTHSNVMMSLRCRADTELSSPGIRNSCDDSCGHKCESQVMLYHCRIKLCNFSISPSLRSAGVIPAALGMFPALADVDRLSGRNLGYCRYFN